MNTYRVLIDGRKPFYVDADNMELRGDRTLLTTGSTCTKEIVATFPSSCTVVLESSISEDEYGVTLGAGGLFTSNLAVFPRGHKDEEE